MKRAVLLLILALGACSRPKASPWLGYGEGDYAFIGAPQPGWVTSLAVERGHYVHPGELLFTLDNTQQQATRDQALATLKQAQASLTQEEANLAYATKELARQNSLAAVDAGTPAIRDQAQNSADQSRARIAQLKDQIRQTQAQLAGADYTLSQRKIIAQTEGPVEDIYFRPGEYVGASTSVLSVLPPHNVYVRFFVPETEFAKVRLGQKVKISCDGCAPMTATVSFISAQEEFTPPVIFSAESRDKLVFKLEARAPTGLPIHPGQPVEVTPL